MLVETNLDIYIKNLIDELTINFPEYNIREQDKNDNGVIYHGIYVGKPGDTMGPVFNVDSFYENGASVDKFIKEVKDYFDNVQDSQLNTINQITSDLKSIDACKNYLYLRVIDGRKADKDMVTVNVRETNNLKYYIVYDKIDDEDSYTVKITYTLLKSLGTTVKELFDIAYENTYNLDYVYLNPLNYSKDYLNVSDEKLESLKTLEEEGILDSGLMTCSLYGVKLGAVASFLHTDDLYNNIQKEFYIIPSSTMETLVVPKFKEDDAKYILPMIKVVNDQELAECDILSYSVFYFDGKKLTEIEKA